MQLIRKDISNDDIKNEYVELGIIEFSKGSI